MVKVNPGSINDLIGLKNSGAPVTLTSHPGNASLYKLVLWTCGVPEHLWDVTCCVADANNWPMYKLKDGQAELLVTNELCQKIKMTTGPEKRFVPAYQFTRSGERLGRVHVRICESLFPGVISSCSRLLLSEVEKVREVFTFLAETRRQSVFGRHITPDGIAVPMCQSGLKPHEVADSFIGVLRELDHLLFSDEPITTKGGACYDGIMVPLATMLVQYWQTGRVDRYDVSGPDMIHYASRPEHQERTSEMLAHLHRWNPSLVPKAIVTRMFPGTVARVGYVPGHISAKVLDRKIEALRVNGNASTTQKRWMWDAAQGDEAAWPIEIKANRDLYFSQHDLAAQNERLVVDDYWRDIPLDSMRETLVRANALLKLR